MRAGYGKKLRQFLSQKTTLNTLIDFGDLPVFEATAYPCIVITQKATPAADHTLAALTVTEAEQIAHITPVMARHAWPLLAKQALTADGWRLEPPEVLNLLTKLRRAGTPLGEYVQGRFYRGILTGYNEAFVIDRATRERLIAEHPSSDDIIKPFLRGRDVKRWSVDDTGLYLCYIPWELPIKDYPAVYTHLEKFKKTLQNRPEVKQGRFPWYALSRYGSEYWQEFAKPKILYQEIATFQSFAWDTTGAYTNNKTFLIPEASLYLLGLLNSKVVWFFLSNTVSKLRGGAYAMQTPYVSQIPIPAITVEQRKAIETLVEYILYLMEQPFSYTNELVYANDRLMIAYFEQLLNGMVYELYLPDELHQAKKQFVQPFLTEDLPSVEQIKGDKLIELRAIYAHLFDKDHPLRRNLYFLDSLDIIRIIEGKA